VTVGKAGCAEHDNIDVAPAHRRSLSRVSRRLFAHEDAVAG